eukprot:snap_masked-scaffold_4-processed-gene-15.23-mRNA-1 protein AED:1.00 eAED:1.00 QI:0/0/0/0/1/1/2/0/92
MNYKTKHQSIPLILFEIVSFKIPRAWELQLNGDTIKELNLLVRNLEMLDMLKKDVGENEPNISIRTVKNKRIMMQKCVWRVIRKNYSCVLMN